MADHERRDGDLSRALARALRPVVRGEVAFDAGSRALVTMDASNYRRVPLGVVAPRDADDVAAALAVCRAHGVPVVPRGGGTSVAGQATGEGVVLDFTRHMNTLVRVDPEAHTAVVQPGLVLDGLRAAAAAHGLTFGPDPSTHGRCTLGGMIGNNACGSHSVAWGTTADNVCALEVLTYGGEHARLSRGTEGLPPRLADGLRALTAENLALLRTRFPRLPRRISGYALDALLPERGTDVARAFTGGEGTLGVVTEATVRLVEAPPARALVVLGYPDEGAAADAAPSLLPHGPLTVEGMATDLVGRVAGLPEGGAWLFAEVGGATPAEAADRAAALVRAARDGGPTGHLVLTEPGAQRALWRVREDAAGFATRLPDGGEAWPGWEDCAVPPERLGAYLRDFRALLGRYGLRGAPYGHFGDGCVHVRLDVDLLTSEGVRRYRRFSGDMADLVVAHGGSLSGEHGDGQARAELLPRMYGPQAVALFERFKDLWDPLGGLNPGMVVRPYPLDANLRFAVLPGKPVDVEFGYRDDGGDFGAAVRRCVGVAKCRQTTVDTGVMCPSYRVTGEERHSTRGRARLLHEMLAGEVVTGGWRSQEVREALDLCLACKGCRSDCPVGVDMATYKAEFLHHHYAGRVRPAAHYALGWLPLWLRAAAAVRAAPVLNAAARTPLAALAKRLGGLAADRTIPELPGEPFTRWWRARGPGRPAGDGVPVVLWPDTLTTHLSPETGRAAVAVLEDAGLRVIVPPRPVCCGLTWVSTGQLTRARAVLRRTLDVMAPALAAGLPVVGLEPSCTAALRTDLPELLPDDPRAARLAAAVRTFARTVEEYAPHWTPPRVGRPVAGQTHCHQHAVLGDAAERRLREKAGLTGPLSGGCCGLAGDFGFTRGHEEVSRACAEEQLLPSLRQAPEGAEILADGFSCRTQIGQLAGVRARHLAEVLAQALRERNDPAPPGRK
ncbi:FAD-binding oxidoreductase [Streptomyces cinnamoneus]|uniref:FAD-binding oxidoreductase n=1 Tax=Streptomyces cinnamoneus TaxID=53446 RepID=A0A2G1XCA5_STRCJ|nr:FAD-binding and (Fe-S)-binding domain-containing protein [Streptomyces cinnamoneus]PHQ48825.1 FAD-binding oxidoreductase [Streptomyces cinnamoneus]PPT14529.1 FAD-binding oxidoreductase [Streptomyces cinnamoneus]